MNKFVTGTMLCLAITALGGVVTPAFAQDSTASSTQETAKTSEPMRANSTTELKKKYMGKHIDELPETTSSTKAVQDGDIVVCKKIKKTGSRLGSRKVCAPKKEWDRQKQEAKNMMRDKQTARRIGD